MRGSKRLFKPNGAHHDPLHENRWESAMKLGMFMMPMHRVGRDLTEILDEDLQTVLHADRVGFDEVWVGQHYACCSEPISSPLTFLAVAIPQTKRITFGTGVINLPQNHPAQVACDTALFDHLSRGRLLFGIGPGGLISDFELFNPDFPDECGFPCTGRPNLA